MVQFRVWVVGFKVLGVTVLGFRGWGYGYRVRVRLCELIALIGRLAWFEGLGFQNFRFRVIGFDARVSGLGFNKVYDLRNMLQE